MSEAEGFPAVATPAARVLILGSVPGLPSLAVNQYYGNPRNAFWRIMAALLEFDPATSYTKRLSVLKKNNIALWDVIGSCYREGSLDSAIQSDTVRVNDFAKFFARHKNIEAVFFNGGKAEQLWRRHVATDLNRVLQRHVATDLSLVLQRHVPADTDRQLVMQRLPSTSPAYAAMPYSRKLQIWREELRRAL